MPEASLTKVVDALRTIGLAVIADETAAGFVLGVRIAAGTLRYAPDARPSNLLHEAAHLAILPANLRALAADNLAAVWLAIRVEFESERCQDPDAAYSRALIQCSDPEATAWAYAFGRHCGLDPVDIIEDTDYDGEGASIRFALDANVYAGVHGLRHAGFLERVRDYPRLTRWLQAGFAEAAGTGEGGVLVNG